MAHVVIKVMIGDDYTQIDMYELDDSGRRADGTDAARGHAEIPSERDCGPGIGGCVAGMWERARRRLGRLKAAREIAAREIAAREAERSGKVPHG